MKTIQMTLDDDLLKSLDSIVEKMKTTRSLFAQDVLKDAIKKYQIKYLEQKHKEGYQRWPTLENEFDIWENEQDWGDK